MIPVIFDFHRLIQCKFFEVNLIFDASVVCVNNSWSVYDHVAKPIISLSFSCVFVL